MPCLFCKIINREIPASIVFEDEHLLAFNDINPQAPTHVLVIPKRHIATLSDLTPEDDAIVSNPPYVADVDRASLQTEVRDHEPALALFAGPDGLHVIRRLVQDAPARLRPGGWLMFEFGYGQADAIEQLITGTRGLRMIELRRDLQNIPRVALARTM